MKNLLTKAIGIAGITALSFLPMNGKGQTENPELTQTKFETYIEMKDNNNDSIFDEYIFVQSDFYEPRKEKIVLRDIDFDGKINLHEFNFLGFKGEGKGYKGGYSKDWGNYKEDLIKRNCNNSSFGAHYNMNRLSKYTEQEEQGTDNLLSDLKNLYF